MAKRGRPRQDSTTTAMSPVPVHNDKPAQNGAETTSGYFRRLFREKPKLLVGRSNEVLLKRWLADHPGHTVVPQNVQKNLANVKGILRKKSRKWRKSKAVDSALAPVAAVTELKAVVKPAPKSLELLEERIDDCLTLARNLDRDGLLEVIAPSATRNAVVWKLGT